MNFSSDRLMTMWIRIRVAADGYIRVAIARHPAGLDAAEIAAPWSVSDLHDPRLDMDKRHLRIGETLVPDGLRGPFDTLVHRSIRIRRPLGIWLDLSDAVPLDDVPWECAQFRGPPFTSARPFRTGDTYLTRWLSISSNEPVAKPGLAILSADPRRPLGDMSPLWDRPKELRRLEAVFRRSPASDQLRFRLVERATRDDLEKAGADGFTALYLVFHGEIRNGETALIFDDGAGAEAPLPFSELRGVLARSAIRQVFVMGCNPRPSDLRMLLSGHVDALVAVPNLFADAAGPPLAADLARDLFHGDTLEQAVGAVGRLLQVDDMLLEHLTPSLWVRGDYAHTVFTPAAEQRFETFRRAVVKLAPLEGEYATRFVQVPGASSESPETSLLSETFAAVLGPAGAGKSLLLASLARRVLTTSGGRVPLLIHARVLAECTSDYVSYPSDIAAAATHTLGLVTATVAHTLGLADDVAREVGRRAVSDGAILLVDGLDEVSSGAGTGIVKTLQALRCGLPDLDVLITVRDGPVVDVLPHEARRFVLVPIPKDALRDLLTQRDDEGHRIFAVLEERHLVELARAQPFFIDILATDVEQTPNSSRARLIEGAIRALLMRGAERAGRPDLAPLDHWMAPLASLAMSELDLALNTANPGLSAEALDFLIGAAGLLIRSNQDVAFSHSLFATWFAARHCVGWADAESRLSELARDPRRSELVVMAASSHPSGDAIAARVLGHPEDLWLTARLTALEITAEIGPRVEGSIEAFTIAREIQSILMHPYLPWLNTARVRAALVRLNQNFGLVTLLHDSRFATTKQAEFIKLMSAPERVSEILQIYREIVAGVGGVRGMRATYSIMPGPQGHQDQRLMRDLDYLEFIIDGGLSQGELFCLLRALDLAAELPEISFRIRGRIWLLTDSPDSFCAFAALLALMAITPADRASVFRVDLLKQFRLCSPEQQADIHILLDGLLRRAALAQPDSFAAVLDLALQAPGMDWLIRSLLEIIPPHSLRGFVELWRTRAAGLDDAAAFLVRLAIVVADPADRATRALLADAFVAGAWRELDDTWSNVAELLEMVFPEGFPVELQESLLQYFIEADTLHAVDFARILQRQGIASRRTLVQRLARLLEEALVKGPGPNPNTSWISETHLLNALVDLGWRPEEPLHIVEPLLWGSSRRAALRAIRAWSLGDEPIRSWIAAIVDTDDAPMVAYELAGTPVLNEILRARLVASLEGIFARAGDDQMMRVTSIMYSEGYSPRMHTLAARAVIEPGSAPELFERIIDEARQAVATGRKSTFRDAASLLVARWPLEPHTHEVLLLGLDEGHPEIVKEAAKALRQLCSQHGLRTRVPRGNREWLKDPLRPLGPSDPALGQGHRPPDRPA